MTGSTDDRGIEAVEITGVAAGGDGVGRMRDGRVVFVPRTAPGDRVRVRVAREGRRWVRGVVEAIEAAGPGRRPAPCPLYDRCGGCQLQHLDEDAQRAAKGRIVADALERIGGVEVEPPEVTPSPESLHYRNRVTFTLRRLRSGRVVAGLHELEHPARVLDVDDRCLLPEEPLLAVWRGLRATWGPGARRLPDGGELRLTLRTAEGGAVLAVEGGDDPGSPGELVDGVDGLLALWHRPSGPDRPWGCLAGDPDAVEHWHDERLPVGPAAFLQVNRGAAAALFDAVQEAVGDPEGRTVVDAYGGVGLHARALARRGARVTLIELDPDAARLARRLAPEAVTVVQGPVERHLRETLPADVVLLNPPRRGLDETVPHLLRGSPPGRVVYVSCDPATLARDLERTGDAFHVAAVRAFDLFPQTAHVETLVVLERAD